MRHLTTDEIIDFVSLTELNDESVKLSATVNQHIRECEECLNLVRSFQMIYDEFSALDVQTDFKNFVSKNIPEVANAQKNAVSSATKKLGMFK